MNPIIALIILVVSFYFLAKIVDEIFIKALDNIANFLKLSPSVAGATFMAAGTSAPELSTTLFSLFLVGANPATGLGTVVGSAIFQILVVIGFSALVKTSYLNWRPVIRDGIFYTFSIIILLMVLRDKAITFGESAMMVSLYVVYLIVLIIWTKFVDESGEPDPIELVEQEFEKPENDKKSILQIVFYPINRLFKFIPNVEKKRYLTIPVFVFSLAAIVFGSYWLVVGGEAFALGIGVPTSIVALTILAGGTSVPELISSAVVAKQGRGDMAISNAIGSNIFDILISLGLPLLIYTAQNGTLGNIDSANINSSVILLFVTMIMVLLLLASQKFKAGKAFGVILMTMYVIYVIAAYSGKLG